MSNDTWKERNLIRNLYGEAWKKKVDKMSDQQVIAVYMKFKREGRVQ